MNNLELKDMEWTEDLFEPLDSSEQNSELISPYAAHRRKLF